MGKVATFLLANMELILAGMSVPVIVCIHLFVSQHFDNPWKVTSAAALTVGILHGTIAWMVRTRQRSVRFDMLQRLWSILQKSLGEKCPAGATEHHAMPSDEQTTRLALAQLVGLRREPLVVRTIPYPASEEFVPARKRRA